MKRIIMLTLQIIVLPFLLTNCNNKTNDKSKISQCKSSDAKNALINELTNRGVVNYHCTLVNEDDENCDYVFQINSFDGSNNKLNIYKRNGSWTIIYLKN